MKEGFYAQTPADEAKYDKAKTDTWTWDAYLTAAQKLHKAGFPVGLPMGQTSDAVDWVGALFNSFGVVMVDEKDNIKINSPETRQALEYLKKLRFHRGDWRDDVRALEAVRARVGDRRAVGALERGGDRAGRPDA